MKNKSFWIITAVIIVIIGVGFYLASKSPVTQGVPDAPSQNNSIVGAKTFERSYSHNTGSATAPVQLVEFGDYQCPVCGAAYAPIKAVTDKYQSDPNFNFEFRNFPLSQHPYSQIAASAVEAAGAQGQYFQMHDLVYANQNDWSGSTDPMSFFTKYAQQLGLNVSQFTSDTTSYKYDTNVQQDEADGNAFGVNATPTFYVLDNGNPTQYVGVGNLTDLSNQIDQLMAKADAANPPKK